MAPQKQAGSGRHGATVDFGGSEPYDDPMNRRGRKGNWVLLSAFLAFFLPAALIGFLAVGMVADQKQIRESEIRDGWSREIARLARGLEAEIEKSAREVFGLVATRFTPEADLPAFSEALKAVFVEREDVSYPFLFSHSGEMLLPRFGNSRSALGGSWMENWEPPVADPLWRRAENTEFSQREPLRAIPLYLELEARLSRPRLPDLYLAVARCYFKAGKMVQAREYGLAAWRQLAAAPLRRDRLDLYALRQLGLVSMRMELPAEAFTYYLRLYEALASRPETLAQDLRFLRWEALDFLRNNRDIQPFLKRERIREIDSQVLDLYRGEISLFSDLADPVPATGPKVNRLDRFLKLKEIFDPESSDTLFYRSVEKRFRSWRPAAGDRELHFRSAVFQRSPYLLAFAGMADRVSGSVCYFGCKLQAQGFFARAWPAMRDSLGLAPGTVLALAGPDGQPLPGVEGPVTGNLLLSIPGRATLAGWVFQLRSENSRFFSSQALRALRWYHALIAALFVSLGLGVILLRRYLGGEKKLLRQKAEFIDMTSHTLKTPLTRLRLLAEKLEQGWTAEPGRARDDCRAIADETAGMAQLVDRMLDFSALQAGRHSYCFAMRDVREWLQGTMQKFKLPLAEKGFQLEMNSAAGLPPACIDAEAMGMVIANLAENALQHAAAGRYLGVGASRRGNRLLLEVSDHGPGIAGPDRGRLFEPFLQGREGTKGMRAGKGLGLAICRQIVEAHGGTIRVEDGPQPGARFVITLPFTRE
jgi:signal transduction histidine kinase